MINKALQFIAAELSEYMSRNMPDAGVKPVVVNSIPDQLKKNSDPDPDVPKASAVLCILNVEEDNLSRSGAIGLSHANRQQSPNSFHAYIYCLIAVTEENYTLALDCLTMIISYFRQHPVFDVNAASGHNSGLKKIVTDAVSQNTEQIWQVWQTIGLPYLPSAVYRFRLTGEFTLPEVSAGKKHVSGS